MFRLHRTLDSTGLTGAFRPAPGNLLGMIGKVPSRKTTRRKPLAGQAVPVKFSCKVVSLRFQILLLKALLFL